MNTSRVRNDRTLLVMVMLAAALLRLLGLGWSLPHTYEEATPLRIAVAMWGWQTDGPVSLNPAFFNYPSLTIYIHFLAQGILFLLLKATGVIASVIDWNVIYITDPTRQYLAARLVGATFGVATVLFAFKAGRIVAGPRAGLLAALFVATSPYHVARSQMIEVDIPLTCFVTLAAYALLRITQHGRTRDYVLAGIAIGLAASSKYTGAFLVVPLMVAHCMGAQRSRWRLLLTAMALFAAAFALTSPYVFLDWQKFSTDMALERDHMKTGHFGTTDAPAWTYYGQALATRLVGVAGIVLALIGAVHLVRGRVPGAWVLLALLATFLGVLMTWSMRADAYALPLVPVILLLSATGLIATAEPAARLFKNHRAGPAAAAILTLTVVAINLAGIAERRESQHDVRTDAQDWIEANLPPGAYIVSENYGPSLLDPSLVLQLKPGLRAKVLQRWEHRPLYAFMALPMYQSRPELAAPFYDIELYRDADYVITTGQIRGRYEKDRARFSAQAAFYQHLDLQCRKLQEFGKAEGTRLTVYQTAPRAQPFAQRDSVAPPPKLARDSAQSTGREAGFYFVMGTNYEYFQHLEEAAASYRLALAYGSQSRQVFYSAAFGYARCLGALGRLEEARADLGRLQGKLRDPQLSASIARLLASMGDAGGGK